MYDDEEYSFKVVCIDAAAAAAAAAAWDIPSISKFEHRLPKINERKITITKVRAKKGSHFTYIDLVNYSMIPTICIALMNMIRRIRGCKIRCCSGGCSMVYHSVLSIYRDMVRMMVISVYLTTSPKST